MLAVILPCCHAGASDHSRVQLFLASTLASSTRERYSAALAAFNFECLERGVSFDANAAHRAASNFAGKQLEDGRLRKHKMEAVARTGGLGARAGYLWLQRFDGY